MKVTPKDWLGSENDRNRENADVYTQLMRNAYGCDHAVLIGHHLCFQKGDDIETENEIPAADSLIFDIDIMQATFGNECETLMMALALLPVKERDQMLRMALQEQCRRDSAAAAA